MDLSVGPRVVEKYAKRVSHLRVQSPNYGDKAFMLHPKRLCEVVPPYRDQSRTGVEEAVSAWHTFSAHISQLRICSIVIKKNFT